MNNSNKKTAVQAAQLRQLFSASNLSLVTSTLLALILAYLQREVIASSVILAWLSLVGLVAFLRAVLVKAYQGSPLDGDTATHVWLVRFRLGVLAVGVVWGAAGFLMFPPNDPPHQMFLIFMLAGLSAGGVVAFSADLISAITFSMTSLLPIVTRLFIAGDSLSLAMSMAGILYLSFMVISLLHINRSITENIVLRLEAVAREEILRTNEERYRLLLKHSPVGIFHYDTNLIITYCNERFADILHNSIDGIVGLDMKKFKDQSILSASQNALKGETIFYEGQYYPTSSDAGIWIDMTCAPSRDGTGKIVGGIAIVRDITERKKAECELKASEAKFRSVIDVSPIPMALTDEQLNIIFLNPAFVQTFGYSIEDIPTLADWYLKAYPDPDYRHWVEAACPLTQEQAEQEQSDLAALEVAICCKDNSIKTVLVSAATIHHNFASVYLVILYDITERKQIEGKLNSIFNASVEGIITFDTSGIIVSANAAVETIFGYQPEELVGYSINKLLPSSPSSSSLHVAERVGQIQEIEGLHKNGSMVPLDLSTAEFVIGTAHYFTYIVRDVSIRKHREQQDKEHLNELAHVTRLGLMGEMASGIAHEVNQPLSAIASYTQVSLNLINAEDPDLVKLTETLHKTQQQALRAGRIIHRMREFIKSHSKHRSTADINALIRNAVDLCMAELKQNDIRLTFDLENNLPRIFVDQIQIEQVILNLIRNSADALKDLPATQQHHILIRSELTLNNKIQVMVKDNGPGLDEEQQKKIVMPFYTTKAEGMGMGLSISRSLIEAHEGTLYFNSKPRKGSTFYFTLPIRKKPDKS
jgi:PAS domain S-box-containing protein